MSVVFLNASQRKALMGLMTSWSETSIGITTFEADGSLAVTRHSDGAAWMMDVNGKMERLPAMHQVPLT